MALRTLDRYVAARFLRMFFLCLAAFVLLYLLIDLIERASQIFKEDPKGIHVVLYFAFKMPMILFQTLPAACLLGSLLSLTVLAKNSELTAVKSGGISIIRVTAPILALGLVISVGAFFLGEFVVPHATQKKDYIYKVGIKKHKWRVKYQKRKVFYKSGNTIYSFGLFVPEQDKITDVRMYRFDEDFRMTERAVAKSARYDAQVGWSLIDGTLWRFTKDRLLESHSFTAWPVDLDEKPDEMKIYQKKSDQMSYRELSAFVRDMEKQGYDTRSYRVDLQGKLAFPFVSLIMTLLGIPFAVRVGRSGGVALATGVSVSIAAVYWIVLGLFLALGHAGTVPPWLAAWGSHGVFGLGGILALTRVRQ